MLAYFGALIDREHDALIFLGRQLLRGVLIQKTDEAEDRHREHRRDRAIVERAVELPPVPAGGGAEHVVDFPGEPAALPVLEQHRAHHRRQRQRDHAGDDDRSRQREGEFAEQRAGETAEEADRRIDRGQRDGHRDHRADDLARALQRGLHRRFALLDMAVDVLHHHDGVVDHEPDRQHHRQQRQQVDAEAHHQHQAADADQRQRNGDDRNDHRAERGQEQEDHDDHDADRLDQGHLHLVDRGTG